MRGYNTSFGLNQWKKLERGPVSLPSLLTELSKEYTHIRKLNNRNYGSNLQLLIIEIMWPIYNLSSTFMSKITQIVHACSISNENLVVSF